MVDTNSPRIGFFRTFLYGKGFDFTTSIIRAEVFISFLAQRMMAASPDAPQAIYFFTFSQDTPSDVLSHTALHTSP